MVQSIVDRAHYDIRLKKFGEVGVGSPFFDSFRRYYGPYYSEWVKKKASDPVYIVEKEGEPVAFMKLKNEGEEEDYSDILPVFLPNRRLKISSFKVLRGFWKLSVKMMDIALSKAIHDDVAEIYGTVPVEAYYKHDLVKFFHRYGFKKVGEKVSHGIVEEVYASNDRIAWGHMRFQFATKS